MVAKERKSNIDFSDIISGETKVGKIFPNLTARRRELRELQGIEFIYYHSQDSVFPSDLEGIYQALIVLASHGFVVRIEKKQKPETYEELLTEDSLLVVGEKGEVGLVPFFNDKAVIFKSDRARDECDEFVEKTTEEIVHSLRTRLVIQSGWLKGNLSETEKYMLDELQELSERHEAMRAALEGTRNLPPGIVPKEKIDNLEDKTAALWHDRVLFSTVAVNIYSEAAWLYSDIELTKKFLSLYEMFCFRYNPQSWWRNYSETKLSEDQNLRGIESREEAIALSQRLR